MVREHDGSQQGQSFLDRESQKALSQLQDVLVRKDELIQKLADENASLRSEQYKDEELRRMSRELEQARAAAFRGFTIDEGEFAQIKSWIERHEKEVHHIDSLEDSLAFLGAIGGNYTYSFIPTSIGIIGTIRCSSCGAELTFQDA